MLALHQELEQRWFLYQYSHDKLFDLYEKGGQTLYRGVDPTADSLHLGNFVGFMHAVQWMKRGNKLILIVWGATGMIGDPWGKDSERSFLDEETLAHNVASITKQVKTVLDHLTEMTGHTFDFMVINNTDFYDGVSYLQFLREVGKHITVNQMIAKETVKRRVEDPEKSISYTEFSYMLLQGYDFLRLYQDYGCKLQIAGSDQWGNCMTGLELIKKICNAEVYAATCPLITDSTGKKFGKSEGNALWLDPEKNSPYIIYQYFMNTADEDLDRYFKLLTLTPFETIDHIITTHHKHPEDRKGQKLLAHAITQTVFGEQAAYQAQLVTCSLFGECNPVEEVNQMNQEDLVAFYEVIGNKQTATPSERLLEILVRTGLAESNGDAKKLINNRCIYINEHLIDALGYELQESDFLQNKIVLLRKGKKTRSSVWNANRE